MICFSSFLFSFPCSICVRTMNSMYAECLNKCMFCSVLLLCGIGDCIIIEDLKVVITKCFGIVKKMNQVLIEGSTLSQPLAAGLYELNKKAVETVFGFTLCILLCYSSQIMHRLIEIYSGFERLQKSSVSQLRLVTVGYL